jgi:hypothetical protein
MTFDTINMEEITKAAHNGVQIIYCRDEDKGMWFLAGVGMGPNAAEGAGDFEADRRRALAAHPTRRKHDWHD